MFGDKNSLTLQVPQIFSYTYYNTQRNGAFKLKLEYILLKGHCRDNTKNCKKRWKELRCTRYLEQILMQPKTQQATYPLETVTNFQVSQVIASKIHLFSVLFWYVRKLKVRLKIYQCLWHRVMLRPRSTNVNAVCTEHWCLLDIA